VEKIVRSSVGIAEGSALTISTVENVLKSITESGCAHKILYKCVTISTVENVLKSLTMPGRTL
jgi:hypothetical protein